MESLAGFRARLTSALLALWRAPAVASAGTRTYKGENFDALTFESVGKYTIETKKIRKSGQELLNVRVSCKPRKNCTIIRKKRFKLLGVDDEANSYVGSFQHLGSECAAVAVVSKKRFDSAFDCESGLFGTIIGQR